MIIERVVDRSTPAGNFPILTKSNYHDWAALMRVMLQARGLWTTMSDGTSDYTEDRMALEVLSKAVPPEMMGAIATKASAKIAWESLQLRNVGAERVRKARGAVLAKPTEESNIFANFSAWRGWRSEEIARRCYVVGHSSGRHATCPLGRHIAEPPSRLGALA
ncbi:hypothetical protein GUJ93_ZPchr0006g45518 [Zizania palustris]|uniref:DUF4219 domain-containing protein n=1 Tax=Zizania palustris TaxID=103762 RepID=A0A8J5SWN1_ZIZPA|nr:hypothetical protein GUJ93_ZPchr0006g45518 [Zizania palustris]